MVFMKRPRGIGVRLSLMLGVLLLILWIAAASITAILLRGEIDEVFDSSLRETAQRLLPLAVVDIVGREEYGINQRLAVIREHDEAFTYLVRDAEGNILLQSHAADPANFPPYDGQGFRQTGTHRLYNDDALKGSVRITVAEPLSHRSEVAREIQMGLGLPILFVIPLALVAILVAVRTSLVPLRRFRERLEARSASDLSHIPAEDLPAEIVPMVNTLNGLLGRLEDAFDAERTFAANAAHELRTPLAGAIAQAQRLRAETDDPKLKQRAGDIEATLKRLTLTAERLMQMARAEGGRLRLDRTVDIREVIRIVANDVERAAKSARISLSLPQEPVMSDLDPDAFGILLRNLLENAVRHGADTAPVEVSLGTDGMLTVANDATVVPPETLKRLTRRFERASEQSAGTGLGLAIVAAIAERIGSTLDIRSPRAGSSSGFEVSVRIPVV
jgi:two-component system OmpR family sensor kinase